MIFDERPPVTRTDKLFGLALVGILVLTTACYEVTDGAALRAAAQEADKPPLEIALTVPLDCKAFAEAVERAQEDCFRTEIPLDRELQAALREACEASRVPVHLALGLIETESGFDPEADNGLCYGLCQLNKRYYPEDLAPAENIRAGVAYLGELLERYGDTAAALTAYNAGRDTGSRTYARAVLAASEKWGCG